MGHPFFHGSGSPAQADQTASGTGIATITPDSISGLIAWYDASRSSSVHATGSEVTQWDDLSGNAHHLTRRAGVGPDTGTRTKNGLNVLDFVSGKELGDIGFSASPYTMFAVCVQDTTPSSPFISTVAYFQATDEFGLRITSTAAEMVNTPGGARVITGSARANGTWRRMTGEYKTVGNLLTLWEDGTSIGTATPISGPNGADKFTVGAYANGIRPLDGAIAEIIICTAPLSGGDRALVDLYLATKWAIP